MAGAQKSMNNRRTDRGGTYEGDLSGGTMRGVVDTGTTRSLGTDLALGFLRRRLQVRAAAGNLRPDPPSKAATLRRSGRQLSKR